MSNTPIWSLRAPRSEWPGTKGGVYCVKVLIGLAVAAGPWLVADSLTLAAWVSGAVFVTTKVCWFLNTKTWPTKDAPADWVCDGVCHFAWLVLVAYATGHWVLATLGVLAWWMTYPWSSE